MPIKFISFWCFLVLIINAKAQSHEFIHYTIKDGLPTNKLYDFLQDKDGFIWFATQNGISKYDGFAFKNYKM